MSLAKLTRPSFHRRAQFQVSALLICAVGLSVSSPALAQTPSAAIAERTFADTWRAVSRVGYGPSANLLHSVRSASSPRAWAVQQVDLAFAASQQPPLIKEELRTFDLPIPALFEHARVEREARRNATGNVVNRVDSQASNRLEVPGISDPVRFSRKVAMQAAAWRLGACADPEQENPLLARMTEFWFNHLNVYVGKGAVRPFLGHYVVHVARAHALGKFEDLLLASARHPAMLEYLDQAQSVSEGTSGGRGRNRGLNENYARELMELHTLGVDGGYTQTDVRELARVLTGWTIGPREASGFRFVERLHDNGQKQVLGKPFSRNPFASGQRQGEEAIRMLARQPSTARRVSLRLAQYFVADAPPADLVKRVSDAFLSSQGDLRVVLLALFDSDEFWQPENRLFKTPMDYACSALLATDAGHDSRRVNLALGFLTNAGQPIHGWQTPDGYKFDAATWLVPEALSRRADFALGVARQVRELEFLTPFMSETTRLSLTQEKPELRAGLALASPDFMYK